MFRFLGRSPQAHSPWLAGSEFSSLQTQLRQWLDNIPASLRFTRKAIYQRKRASQLGALLLCHFTYHQTMSDLTGISMKDMSSIPAQVKCPPEKATFLKVIQDQCFEHNMALCALFEEASSHGMAALADSWLSVVAHGSARVIIEYITLGLGSSREKGEALRTHAIAAVHSDIRALKSMIPTHALAQSLVSARRRTHTLSIRGTCCADGTLLHSTPTPLMLLSKQASLHPTL